MAFQGGLAVQAEFRAAQAAKSVISKVYVSLLSTRLHGMLRAAIPGA